MLVYQAKRVVLMKTIKDYYLFICLHVAEALYFLTICIATFKHHLKTILFKAAYSVADN